MVTEPPVLYHLAVSHYSEKARWALSYKRVRHVRRPTPPGAHMALSFWLTRGTSYTLPLLVLRGRAIGDSTEIIAALEHEFPDRPLYPADPAERERALALEDFFDEELAPSIRRFAFGELSRDPEALGQVLGMMMPEPLANAPAVTAAIGKPFVRLRYGAGPTEAGQEALAQTLAALDRIEAELDGRSYLVGSEFTVADLAGAALLFPAVGPAEGPQLPPLPQSLQDFREEYADRTAIQWVREMYSRHRGAP